MMNSARSERLSSFMVLSATVAMLVFNVFAAMGYVGGVTPKTISDAYPTILTPADYAFSIWSLIYLALLGFSVFQMMPGNNARFRPGRSLYIASCVLNCAWIFAFHSDQIGVSLVVILLLWTSLLLLNIRLSGCHTTAETWLMQAPLGIYFGWVTAAALVNLMLFLKAVGSPQASSAILGSALMIFSALAAIGVRLRLGNFFYPLAIAWAATAIAVKQSGNTAIVASAAIAVVICLVTTGSFVVNLNDSTGE